MNGEVFQADTNECVRMMNENFDEESNTSISVHEQTVEERSARRHVMITDLDKSTEGIRTLDDHANEVNAQMRTPNRVLHFHESMVASDIICLIGEFESKVKLEAKIEMPLHFEWGTFKRANVTVRKYADLAVQDADKDFTLVAETAIIRDAEVLR